MVSDKTIFSNTTGAVTSAAMQQVLVSLQNQKVEANAQLTQKQQALAQASVDRQLCKKQALFGNYVWDNTCLDRNTALSASLRTEIAVLQQRIIDLDTQISKAQADYQAAVASESAAAQAQAAAQTQVLQAQALANPETAAVMLAAQTAQKQAVLDAESDKQGTLIYAAAGVVVLIIVAVAAILILKK